MYWVAKSWGEIKPETLVKSWNKILHSGVNVESETDDDDDQPLSSLIKKLPGCENANETEVSEWMKNDEQFEVTDVSIVEMVSEPVEESEEEDLAETVPMMTHSEGFAALDALCRTTGRGYTDR